MKHELIAPLEFNATALDSGVKPFTGICYSGGVMGGPSGPSVVDIATVKYSAPAPLLWQHDQREAAGMIDRFECGSDIRIHGRIFRDGRGREILEKAERGFAWQLSIGLYAAGITEIGPNETIVTNGRELKGPLALLRSGRIREVSVVTLGADDKTELKFGRKPYVIRAANGRYIAF